MWEGQSFLIVKRSLESLTSAGCSSPCEPPLSLHCLNWWLVHFFSGVFLQCTPYLWWKLRPWELQQVLARLNTRNAMEIPSHSTSTGTRKEKNKLCYSDHAVYPPALLFACEYERYLLCPSANIVLVNTDGCITCGLAALILPGMMFSVLTGEPSKGRSFTSASSF